ncbi:MULTISPECIES: pyrimidine utilization protein D [unclassified Caulobacter]|uniref:pyrimidine utilization protein D n=1 Tax=unclassified Caulobacter TaxID=2648921 RepID=UPI0007827425|nr:MULTISPECIES: pyrimidine utilization protein D [unclassified Caulobacter]AZS22622.1 pyrimidine utilization protein D [Caulobacter sp. FWC26]
MTSGVVDGIFYELHGGPVAGRDAVLLSSGLGGSGAFWAPQMQALTERWPVVTYDHRGTGRSVRELPPHYTIAHMADDMVKVMDALGLSKAHVVGHAAGGNAGLQLALDHPDRLAKLVVVNGWSRPDPHIKRCFDTRLHLLNDTGPEAYVHAQPIFLYPADWISRNHTRLMAEEAHHVAGFPPREVMLARINALLAFDIDARLEEITHRVLISASADDMLVPMLCSQRLAGRLPNADFQQVAWGGHGFTVTDPETFNEGLVTFLEGT